MIGVSGWEGLDFFCFLAATHFEVPFVYEVALEENDCSCDSVVLKDFFAAGLSPEEELDFLNDVFGEEDLGCLVFVVGSCF